MLLSETNRTNLEEILGLLKRSDSNTQNAIIRFVQRTKRFDTNTILSYTSTPVYHQQTQEVNHNLNISGNNVLGLHIALCTRSIFLYTIFIVLVLVSHFFLVIRNM